MDPQTTGNPRTQPGGLLAAALAATAGVWASRVFGLPGCAVAIAVAALWCERTGRAGPWLAVVPAALAAVTWQAPPAPWPRPGPVWISAVIDEVSAGQHGQALLRVHALRGGAEFRCTVDGRFEALPGDVVRGPGRLAPQEMRRRRGQLPWVALATEAVRLQTGSMSIERLAEQLRRKLQRALLVAVPGDRGVLLCHLVLGRGPPMPTAAVAAHRDTGLIHLLAVSGAHASMLALMAALLFGSATGRSPFESGYYRLGCGVFLSFYAVMTGLEPPVFRAVLAFCLILWSRARGRRVTITTALAGPALVTAIVAPQDLMSASFCLSYAAVAGLALAGTFTIAGRRSYWRTACLASLWATLMTAPLTLLYFGQIAPWSILATPLLAPLVAAMLAGGLVVAVIGCVWAAAADWAAIPLELLTATYSWLVSMFASLPLAPVHALAQPEPTVLAATATLGAAWLWVCRRASAVAILCVLLIIPHFVARPVPPDRLTLLAVGHGQSCLAWIDGTSVLIDCGSLGGGRNAARAAACALLPQRRFDWLVLTHADGDHTAGVPALLEQVRITAAAVPAEMMPGPLVTTLRAHGVRVVAIAHGQRTALTTGVVVQRPTVAIPNDNDSSLWLRFSFTGFTAVVTGDPLAAGVDAALECGAAAVADIAVLPHHGRANERCAALLDAIAPRLALVSNRTADTPSSQAMTARQRGITTIETGAAGNIQIELDDNDRALWIGTEWQPRIPLVNR